MQPHELPRLAWNASGTALIEAPPLPRQVDADVAKSRPEPDLIAQAVAMASHITVHVPGQAITGPAGRRVAAAAVERAMVVFDEVNEQCTRFVADSDLMRANAAPADWTRVGRRCFEAVQEAESAYRLTGGRFDPRVLDDLVRLGYEHSFTRGGADPRTAAAIAPDRPPLGPWEPAFRPVTGELRLCRTGSDGDDRRRQRVDLGGIGKGLAVRWASAVLADTGYSDFLIDAGGDCFCAGRPADAPLWHVGVEDPAGGPDPVAVLGVTGEAVATSSVRLRRWEIEGREVHHLIDPVTGRSGGAGLRSVTVVHPDPATAEIWSKVLFLAGASGIAREAEQRRLPALWVRNDGSISASPFVGDRLVWRRS